MSSVMDERIRRWRLELALRYGLLRRELDELEDHVRREVAESLEGVDPPSDERVGRELDDAIDQLGDSRAIARELRKSRRWDVAHSLAGFGLVAFFVLASTLLGGALYVWIDVPSVFMVFGVVAGGLWATYRPKRVLRAVALGMFRRSPEDMDELVEAEGLLEAGRNLAWGSGMVGALMGLIAMFSDLGDPTSIGAGLAITLLCPLYGGMLAEFFLAPMRQTVKARRDQIEAAAGLASA